MRRLAFTVVVASTLLASAPANADLGRRSDSTVTAVPIVQRFLSAAASYWGVTQGEVASRNNCHYYTVEVGETVNETLAESPEPGCWQRIGTERWDEIAEGNERLGCLTVEHEYGHSTGHPDETVDPTQVMFEEGPPLTSVPGCMAFPLHGPRISSPHGGAHRTVRVKAGQRLAFHMGLIPKHANAECTIFIDGREVPQVGAGPFAGWAVTTDTAVETITQPKRAPLTVRVVDLAGRHRVTVHMRWSEAVPSR